MRSNQEIREGINAIIQAIPEEGDKFERIVLREKILTLNWVLEKQESLIYDKYLDERLRSLLGLDVDEIKI